MQLERSNFIAATTNRCRLNYFFFYFRLALLWYHTIVRPFYAIDGNNVQAGVDVARTLLKESEEEYGKSALMLFFSGRVSRLNVSAETSNFLLYGFFNWYFFQSDIKSALKSFQKAAENANQREIRLLSLHEVGWCHLIELDYCAAESVFAYLHTASRWSRCFYAYLAAICSGNIYSPLGFNSITIGDNGVEKSTSRYPNN